MKPRSPSRRFGGSRRSGFTLVEVTLSLGVAGFCLVSLVGLLTTGLTSNRDTSEQLAAMNVASALVADLRATPASLLASPRYQIQVPTADPSKATVSTSVLYVDESGATSAAGSKPLPSSRYRVEVNLRCGAAPTGQPTVLSGTLKTSWPALASAQASGQTVVSLALNR